MRVFELFYSLDLFFFKLTQLDGALTTELLSKDVELKLLPLGIFTFFLSYLTYSGDWGPITVWHPIG